MLCLALLLTSIGTEGSHNDLKGWDFSGQDLTGGNFVSANLAGAQLTGADTRGVFWIDLTGALARNAILPDGRILELALSKGERLLIRDDDAEHGAIQCTTYGCGPMSRDPVAVTITDRLQAADGSELQLLFDGDPWNSLISFVPGIPVELGGTLALTLDERVDASAEVGRTLRIFDWTGVTPQGGFEISSPYQWDATKLYTTGEVTLRSVPEPSAAMALLIGVMAIVARCRGSQAVRGINP